MFPGRHIDEVTLRKLTLMWKSLAFQAMASEASPEAA
jgi:hypothetical protein